MDEFTKLHNSLANSEGDKASLELLKSYFAHANTEDAQFAYDLLTGKSPTKITTTAKLRDLALEQTHTPAWLFQECRELTDDVVEALSSLDFNGLKVARSLSSTLAELTLGRLQRLWRELDYAERYILNKIAVGSFRPGVKPEIVRKAWAEFQGIATESASQQPRRKLKAVLLYAHFAPSTGLPNKLNLSIWDAKRQELLPLVQAEPELASELLQELARWIRSASVDKFGPVITVPAVQIFEISFTEIERAPRRKIGIQLLDVRIEAWLRNELPESIASVNDL
jgi:hypothetical protein